MSGPSFGVEEEFLLVDPITGRPVPRACETARRAAMRGAELQLEFTTAQVETATGKADTSLQLRQDISKLRACAAESARRAGAILLAVALPPALDEPIALTDSPRYRRMGEHLGALCADRGNCGCHVHVEVPSRDAAIAVSNWLRPWLPVMLALTANSAIYRDVDTRYASWRHMLWSRWPSAGPPPYFDSVADYDRTVAMLFDSGAILDEAMIYWYVRPSVRFPTVEIRVADVPATAAETVLYATLVRAAVVTALASYERGEPAPNVPDHVIAAACWKAAHDGLGGELIDVLESARSQPATRILKQWLRVLGPALEATDDIGWVCPELRRVLLEGNGAARQEQVWGRRNNVMDVITDAAAATIR
ncbi:MAG: glutamate--cysteine ligase [Mycobacterium sp.]|nr:glutamate--cysteine ligase [Mycobacterium sp.]